MSLWAVHQHDTPPVVPSLIASWRMDASARYGLPVRMPSASARHGCHASERGLPGAQEGVMVVLVSPRDAIHFQGAFELCVTAQTTFHSTHFETNFLKEGLSGRLSSTRPTPFSQVPFGPPAVRAYFLTEGGLGLRTIGIMWRPITIS